MSSHYDQVVLAVYAQQYEPRLNFKHLSNEFTAFALVARTTTL